MDTLALVNQEIEDGRKLIALLAEKGFEMTVACWVKSGNLDRWDLYIATGASDSVPIESYHELYESLDRIQDAWISLFQIRLIPKNHPIARFAQEIRAADWGRVVTPKDWYDPTIATIEEIYVYPPPVLLRQGFVVTYQKRPDENVWRATVTRGEMYRNMKSKGAVAYTAANWAGGDLEDRATVSVLLEIDPRFDDQEVWEQPETWKLLTDQARAAADDMFRVRHPGAVIEDVVRNLTPAAPLPS